MNVSAEGKTIGVLASLVGVNVETIRFYQRRGLLPEPQKPYGGIRRYSDREASRVKFIKSAQRLGFSLDEIAGLLKLEDGTHCAEAQALAEQKLDGVRARLADLRRMESALTTLVGRCQAGRGSVCCPLISALQHDEVAVTKDPVSTTVVS